MIREVIRPQYTNFTINIPTSYIDKEVELIMFPLDERETTEPTKQNEKPSLRGVFNQYANSSKIELENNAWKNNIINKYTIND